MRKKYRTLEELREANAERQRKWREGHSWENAQRVKAALGTKKVKVTIHGYGVVDVPEWVLAVASEPYNVEITKKSQNERRNDGAGKAGEGDADTGGHGGRPGEETAEELTYEADPEDCRTPAEKVAYEARIKRWAPARRMSEPSEQGSAHEKAVEDLVALVARKKEEVRGKGGPGVRVKLEGV
jgi:hypothetical protein